MQTSDDDRFESWLRQSQPQTINFVYSALLRSTAAEFWLAAQLSCSCGVVDALLGVPCGPHGRMHDERTWLKLADGFKAMVVKGACSKGEKKVTGLNGAWEEQQGHVHGGRGQTPPP